MPHAMRGPNKNRAFDTHSPSQVADAALRKALDNSRLWQVIWGRYAATKKTYET